MDIAAGNRPLFTNCSTSFHRRVNPEKRFMLEPGAVAANEPEGISDSSEVGLKWSGRLFSMFS